MTCAFAVRGALKKLVGVESVDVSLNKGRAVVKLKPGNTLRPDELWETVRKNGFTPKQTSVRVRGEWDGSKLKVSGSGQSLDVVSPALMKGKVLVVLGTLVPGKDVKAPMPLRVTSVEK